MTTQHILSNPTDPFWCCLWIVMNDISLYIYIKKFLYSTFYLHISFFCPFFACMVCVYMSTSDHNKQLTRKKKGKSGSLFHTSSSLQGRQKEVRISSSISISNSIIIILYFLPAATCGYIEIIIIPRTITSEIIPSYSRVADFRNEILARIRFSFGCGVSRVANMEPTM